MQVVRHKLRSFTWVALFAVFGLVLGPALAYALNPAAAGADPAWVQICSVTAQPGGAPSHDHTPLPGLHLEHCPLCAHFGAAPALPAATVAGLQAPAGADFVAALFAASPLPLFAWIAAQPRGPPRTA